MNETVAEYPKDKKIVISLSVLPATRDRLHASAKRLGMSVSGMTSTLIDKHLSLIDHDGHEIPVIFKIPQELKGDKDGLRTWLNTRTEAVVSRLGN